MVTFIFIFSLILIARSNSFLLGYELLNVDESQMMANAVRFQNNGYNIFEFDGTSSGFLNSLILNWPNTLGYDVTFLSTRITAIFIISLIFYICYMYFRFELNRKLSFLLILPGLVFFSFTHDPDFLHYSSELLSTLFLLICLYGFKKNFKIKNPNVFYFGMVLIGLIIFSKTQIIPTASLLAFSICCYSIKKKEYKILRNCIILFFSPIILIIGIYFLKGYFNDYFINYFEFSKAVASKYSLGENILSQDNLETKIINKKGIINHFLYNSVFHFFYFQVLLTIYLTAILFKLKKISEILEINFILVIVSIIMVSFSILVTGAIYRHYLIPLIPLSILFTGSLFIKSKDIIMKSYLKKKPIYLLIIIFLSTFVFESKKFYSKNYDKISFSIDKINFSSPNIFSFLNINKGNIFVWGWSPQIYVLSNLHPSDRATISQKNIENYSNKEYFNSRLIKDIKKNEPNLILDYVKPKSFYYNDPKQGISTSPINKIVKEEYFKIENLDQNCPDLYLLKKDYKILKSKLVNFKIRDPRFKKLDNFSVSKKICEDSVNFDSSYEDNLVLKIDENTNIKKILILSSHINDKNVEIPLYLRSKNNIYDYKIVLKQYPFWSKVEFEKNKFTNEVVIDVSKLKKFNFGINEIKLYTE
ncbi:MAG: hypothetical protein ISQ91_01910 [Candidatus Pelagibacter bacterium]|nr:hypothetical protein [Candidatus Pelagibacter bacterium]